MALDGATSRLFADEVLSQFLAGFSKSKSSEPELVGELRVAALVVDEVTVVAAVRRWSDEEALLSKAATALRTLGASMSATFARRWPELALALDRLVDASSDKSATQQQQSQWDSFLASSLPECERLAASMPIANNLANNINSSSTSSAASSAQTVSTSLPALPMLPPPPPLPRSQTQTSPLGSPRPSGSPRPPISPRPASPRPPSPRSSPRPAHPTFVPLMFSVAPSDGLQPADLREQAWMGDLTPLNEGDSIYVVLHERAFHYSTSKDLNAFYMVNSLMIAPSKAIKSYPLSLSFELENVEFADELVGNPAVGLRREDGGLFVVTLPHAAESWEVLRILVQKQFPVVRVPLRLVPAPGRSSVLEVTYEMNPVVEEMATVVMEVLLDCDELAVEVVKNKQGEKIVDTSVDARNKVVRVIVGKIPRTERWRREKIVLLRFIVIFFCCCCRRNKVFIHLVNPAKIVSVSCGFTASKKPFFCQMQPKFKDARVVIDSNLKSKHYFAKP